jgi:Tfp pilus assembly protein PilF
MYYSITGQSEKSIFYYNQAINKKIVNSPPQEIFLTFYNLGVEYYKMEHLADAMHYFQKAGTIKPNFGPLQNNMGLIFLLNNNYSEAEIRFQEAIKYTLEQDKALSNLGLLKIKERDFKNAEPLFYKAMDLEPQNFSAQLGLSRIYLENKEYGKAFLFVKSVLDSEPDNIMGLLSLAGIYYALGENERVENILDTLVLSSTFNQLTRLMMIFREENTPIAFIMERDTALFLIEKALDIKQAQ